MLVALVASLSSLLLSGPGQGVQFEQTTVTYAGGRATGPGVSARVFCAGRRMRLEPGGPDGGPAFILRLDESKAYRIDPVRKIAVAVDVPRLRARSQMDLAMAGDLMGAGAGEARTTPLSTTKVIAGLPCKGFRIAAGSTVMDLYVSEAVPVGIDTFAEFLEWSGASQALAGIIDEMLKLPGFPLETRSRVTVLGEVHETRSTVTRIETGPQPAALFEPPPGYRIVPEDAPTDER
jgi:hypothetical protein